MSLYSRENPRKDPNNDGIHDLLVDDVMVLEGVSAEEVERYIRGSLLDDDWYKEEHMSQPMTGAQLKQARNRIQSELASDDPTFTPDYW